MVTGGFDDGYSTFAIATTEILRVGDDAWTYVGNLPSTMAGLRGVNLGNRLLMTGTNSIDKIVV